VPDHSLVDRLAAAFLAEVKRLRGGREHSPAKLHVTASGRPSSARLCSIAKTESGQNRYFKLEFFNTIHPKQPLPDLHDSVSADR